MLARCGSTYPVTSRIPHIILSPGYPAPYQPYTYCRWNFYSLDGPSAVLQVQCQLFEMEASSECSSGAFLALQTLDNQEAERFCGSEGPRSAVGSHALTIHFWGGWRLNADKRGVYCAVTSLIAPLTPPPTSSCRCGRRGTVLRIVGGQEANLHEWPWMALLVLPGGGLCGGTLINDRFVLTAAHCIDGTVLPRNALPTVVLGEHQRSVPDETPFTRVVRVARVITHEGYDGAGNSKNNDIGLVELAAPLDLGRSPGIAPACPPAPNTTDAAQRVTTLGWGFTSVSGEQADVLQMVELLPVPLTKCRDQYEAGIITENMICAAATNKDSCFDDSGGPLMTEVESGHWELIGVVSFGPSVCAQQGVAGVYTRVVNYLPWISSKIGLPTTCPAV